MDENFRKAMARYGLPLLSIKAYWEEMLPEERQPIIDSFDDPQVDSVRAVADQLQVYWDRMKA